MGLSRHHCQYSSEFRFGRVGLLVEDFLNPLRRISGGEGNFEGLGSQDVVGEVGEESIEEEGEDVRSGGGVDEVRAFVEEAAKGVGWRG